MGVVIPLTHENSNTNTGRLLFLSLLLPLFLLSITTVYASFTDEWGEYQDDETTAGFVNDISSNFVEFGTTFTVGAGGDFQPLAVNMTGNGDLEIIIYSGNFLQLYNEELFLIDELNIGAANEGQPIIYNNGTTNIAISISGDVLEAHTYNGSSFIDKFANDSTLNLSFSCDTWLGLRCEDDFCYTICDNGTDTFIASIDMLNANFTNSVALSPNIARGIPTLADIDRDGNTEIGWVCDANGDGDYGICVADLNTLALDTVFSTDGIIDDISLTDRIGNPTFNNINEGGDLEVIIAYATPDPFGLTIRSYNSDGSVSWTTTRAGGATNAPVYMGNPIIMEFPSVRPDVCAFGKDNSAADVITFICVEFDGTSIVEDSFVYGGVNVIDQGWNSFAGPVIDGAICTDATCDLDLVTTRFIMDRSQGWNITLNLTQLDNDYFIAYADVNDDSEGEIIATKAGTTRIIYSNFSNQPPEVNNTQNFGGYGGNLDYRNPICVGSTLTFLAQECGGTATCNYDNDGSSDQERIVSNCGQLTSGAASTSFITNTDNGTFAGASPSFQCVYNVTGIFSVRLFLQDNLNDDVFTEFNTQTITVQVINGTPGITCNLGSAVSPGDTGGIVVSAQESQTNEAIDDTLGILFGSGSGSDKLKLIVGIALILGIIAAAYREGVKDGTGVLVVAGLATLLVTFIGLITPAIFILGLALVLFVLFLGRSLTGGGAPNGGP